MATVLYRKSLLEDSELEIIQRLFPSTDCMVGIHDDLVIGRCSCVPFYDEVEKGLAVQGSRLINTYSEHRYIANFDYYWDIQDLTFKTWFRLADVPRVEAPFVVKGTTTSKKHEWNKKMFAPTFADAVAIATDLKNDYYIGQQDIIVRKYEPLMRLGTGTHDMPFTNEWRFFFYRDIPLSYGFYWTECETKGVLDEGGIEIAKRAANILSKHTNYFTVDIGQKADGSWVVIEVNDGQMAGLSHNNPLVLYENLKKALS